MNNNQQQSTLSSLTMVIGAVFSVLVATGKLSASDSTLLQNALYALIPAAITIASYVWKLVQTKDATLVLSASKVAGVQPIKIDTSMASPSVAAIANDPTPATKTVTPA